MYSVTNTRYLYTYSDY